MSTHPEPISGLVLLTPKQKRFVQEVNKLLEFDPLPRESADTLKSIFSNILNHPDEIKFRRLKSTNQKFHERVGSIKSAVKVLEKVGFELKEGEFLRHGMLQEEDVWELKTILEVLSNPNMPIKPSDILFCEETGDWGEFSNFYPVHIKVDNKVWPTTEHYFQAQKFVGTKYEEEIRTLSSPNEAKQRGSSRTLPLRKDWESVKEEVMYKANLAKFSQHEKLKQKLLSTGKAKIVENNASDGFWGNGSDGNGKNRLGFILMRVRDSLQNSPSAAASQKATPTPAAAAAVAQKTTAPQKASPAPTPVVVPQKASPAPTPVQKATPAASVVQKPVQQRTITPANIQKPVAKPIAAATVAKPAVKK